MAYKVQRLVKADRIFDSAHVESRAYSERESPTFHSDATHVELEALANQRA